MIVFTDVNNILLLANASEASWELDMWFVITIKNGLLIGTFDRIRGEPQGQVWHTKSVFVNVSE